MQLKYFFVFLLVFLISVAESSFYSQESTSRYYHSSKLIQKKTLRYKNTKHIVFNNNALFSKYFLVFFFPKIDVKNEFQKQIQLILKLQKLIHLKIALLNNKHTFLTHKNTASNSISNLYIA